MIRILGRVSIRYSLWPIATVFSGRLNPLVILVFPKRLLLTQLLPCVALTLSAFVAVPSTVTAQSSSSSTTWKTWAQTFTREEPVTEYCWEEKEVMETSYKKKMVPVYQTETVEKKTICYRPVKKTTERVERYKELEPVTVTKFREREIRETKYDTVTEMREEQYISKRPVTETVMRDKQFNVREKVTEKGFQYRDVTTYKPTTVADTELVPSNVLLPTTPPLFGRRAQWLRPGYYTDPKTGLTDWKRRGLHWTAPTPALANVPALVPQTTSRTEYVPEVSRKAEPVEISRFVDRVETRKVPVEVQRIEETIETRKVPVEVKRPRQVTRVEKIPYTETTYREVERVKRVPVVEETMQKVETIEPVEKTSAKWVEKEEAIQTPKIVRRKVAYTTTKKVPYTIKMRVRVDSFGNSIGEPEPADPQWRAWFKAMEEQSKRSLTKTEHSEESMESVVEKPQFDESSIYYSNPDFRPLNAPEPKAADMVPSLKESVTNETAAKKTAAPETDVPSAVNTVGKPRVKSDNRVRSILVPETKQEFVPTKTMATLGGKPIQIETDSDKSIGFVPNSAATPTPAKPTVDVDVMENKFVAPVKTKTETNLKPTWKTFDPQLIKQPAAPSAIPAVRNNDAISVPGIDRVEELKRQPVSDIY